MVEMLMEVQLELSLIMIIGHIFYSLIKIETEGLIVMTSVVIAVIVLTSVVIAVIVLEYFGGEIFSAGMAFVVSLYALFLGWSLLMLKQNFKILSNINTDILLFLGLLFAWRYTEAEVIKTSAFWIVLLYFPGELSI